MGQKKTFYLNDENIILLDQLKMKHGFKNMNEILRYFFTLHENTSTKGEEVEQKIMNDILKNTEILLEIVSYQADKDDAIPKESYKSGFIASYAEAEKLYNINKEREIKLAKEQNML